MSEPTELHYAVLTCLVAGLVGVIGVLLAARRLQVGRHDIPYAAIGLGALAVRWLVAGGLALLPDESTLRGTDEQSFLILAEPLSDGAPLGDWIEAGRDESMAVLIALPELLLGGSPAVLGLRMVTAGLAVVGLLLAVAAVQDLTGPRAAWVAAAFLIIDPGHVFFSTVLGKEVFLLFAEGVFLFAAVRWWREGSALWIGGMLGGAAVATIIRPYAGAALLVVAWVIVFHVSFRDRDRHARRRLVLVILIGVAGLGLAQAALPRALARVQQLQNTQTTDTSNLRLEPVDFSTPGAVAANLPGRVGDYLLQPYPWQTDNNSQKAAVIGTILTWAAGLFLVAAIVVRGRGVFARAGPLFYVLMVTTLVYALTTGNAGTGFRHRVHLTLVIALLVGVAATTLGRRRRASLRVA
jgi:hypothetical protein